MQIQIDTLSVHVEQLGSGSDVVLLHGWGYGLDVLMPLAGRLAARHRVTLIDLPGHGGTSEPEEPYTIEDFASVVAKTLEHLGIRKAHFAGHSNGGRTIIALSRNHSQIIDRIALMDASGIRPKRSAKYYFKVYTYKAVKAILRLPIFPKGMLEKYVKGKGSADYRVLSPVMKATFSSIVNEDLTGQLKSIKSPTILIWGDKDTDTPLYMGKIMQSLIPDSALIVYEGKGHYAFAEDMNKTVAVLDSFFN